MHISDHVRLSGNKTITTTLVVHHWTTNELVVRINTKGANTYVKKNN